MEATPAAVRRIFDAVDHSRADPAASAASVERIDSEDKRTALANRVLIDALPVAARVGIAKAVGVGLGNVGSGASWRQALWAGCAMTPMSSIALLIASQFVVASPSTGYQIASVALPAILLMEVLGAVIATVAIYRAGESSKPWAPLLRGGRNGESNES